MPDTEKFSNVPEARTVSKKHTKISLVWVIPIVAAVAGVWIAVTRILEQGPEITITFSSGDGLEAHKTKIIYDGLTVGELSSIRLASNHKDVIATAEMDPKTKDFLVKDMKFWVVKPRVSGLNITGLGTLISGYYIGVQMGQSKESERNFIALESPPVGGDIPGRFFQLQTRELGSLGEGTPIYFRQIQAGQVVSYTLDNDGKHLSVKIFVQSPYDQFITPDTRFWNASGVDLSLTAAGLQVRTESVLSLLAGGIAFETPIKDSPQPPAPADTMFTLFDDRADAFRAAPHNPHHYLLVFDQSVRGLAVGAPVELNGIQIGEVVDIQAQFDAKTAEFSVPVIIELDPLRYGVKYLNLPPGAEAADNHQRVMDALVARGLRAELKTGNLISGSLFVAIDFYPDEPPVTLDWSQKPVQLPTHSGQFAAIADSAGDLVKNLNTAVSNLNLTITSARGTLTNTDKLLTSTDKLMGNANELLAPNSVLNAEVNTMLQQGGEAAEALRVLLDYLERHPEALIHGKPGEAKP
jgi:paraquat-inducible protein B